MLPLTQLRENSGWLLSALLCFFSPQQGVIEWSGVERGVGRTWVLSSLAQSGGVYIENALPNLEGKSEHRPWSVHTWLVHRWETLIPNWKLVVYIYWGVLGQEGHHSFPLFLQFLVSSILLPLWLSLFWDIPFYYFYYYAMALSLLFWDFALFLFLFLLCCVYVMVSIVTLSFCFQFY